MKRVCILLSVQDPFEIRLFHREARTLASNGYCVTIIARCNESKMVEGIKIIGIGEAKNRIWRILGTWKVFKRALREKTDIYMFLNPELLFWGVVLRIVTGKPVVYDCHEHFPDTVRIKPYIPPLLRVIASILIDFYERSLAYFVNCIVTADEETTKRFTRTNRIVVTLFNFPRLEYFKTVSANYGQNRSTLIHSGSLGKERGGDIMVESLKLVKDKIPEARLVLIGKFEDSAYKNTLIEKIERNDLQDNVIILEQVPHVELINHIAKSNIGLSLLQPCPKHQKNIPQKIFEYMACGIPVVASDLSTARPFIEPSECGILVDPTNPKQLAEALIFLLQNPEDAKRMGENGRKAVLEKYNWETESKKLLAVYKELLGMKDTKQ